MDSKPGVDQMEEPCPTSSYALSGKIMLTAIVVLLVVFVFLISIHIYARWYLHRMRLRHLRRSRRRRRRTDLVLYVEPNITTPSATARGLDADVLNSLPVFVYPSAGTHPDSLQCAVCLSEFAENEKGRFLPKCNHNFHIDCIDMWFHSHSTCPICRSPVEPVTENTSLDVAVEPGSSTDQVHEEHVSVTSSTTSLGDPRKAFDMGMSVTIEVSRRIESDELELSSSASQGFKPSASRLQSFKRMLSLNRKHGTSGGSTTELDTECVRDELTQQQTRVETPR